MTRDSLRAGRARRLPRFALLTLAAAIMAGCATPRPEPTMPTPPVPEVRPEVAELPAPERAALLRTEAASQRTPDAVRAAVEATLEVEPAEIEGLEEAERLWQNLDPRERTSLADRVRGARLAAARGEWELARERLGADDPDDPTRTEEVYREGLALHARLLEQEQQWYQALRARLSLDGLLLLEPDAQLENQRRIWGLLSALRPAQREQLERDGETGTETAWVALFRGLRGASDAHEARQLAADWEQRYPGHPATILLPELLDSHPLQARMPDDVMVLLPLSGSLADLGNALLDGITRAYYSETGGRGRLIIRDTRGDPEVAAGLYRQAVAGNVDHVIGPLHRDAVEAVAASEETRPTVLLNRAALGGNGDLTSLALNPEEDARAVADRAARAGWRLPLAILPEGDFGDRLAAAWDAALGEHGLQARGIVRVDTGSGDLNARVASALGIDSSQARIRGVASRTGLDLEGDAQIRGDIDHLFIGGTARQVRQLVPHLHFHGGGRLPMMATAHAYTGQPDPARDRDLRGIVFPDAPWLFDAITPLDGAEEPVALPRFTALGMDAMRLVLHGEAIREAPHHRLTGGAGTWSLNPFSGEWVREPAWARFEGGEPQRIDPAGER